MCTGESAVHPKERKIEFLDYCSEQKYIVEIMPGGPGPCFDGLMVTRRNVSVPAAI